MREDASVPSAQKQMISPDLSAGLPKPPGAVGSRPAPPTGGPAPDATKEPSLQAYIVFDPQTWTKTSKELPVRPEQLEDRFPAHPPASLLVKAQS